MKNLLLPIFIMLLFIYAAVVISYQQNKCSITIIVKRGTDKPADTIKRTYTSKCYKDRDNDLKNVLDSLLTSDAIHYKVIKLRGN